MRVVKPTWVVHPSDDVHKAAQTLYSVSVHPDQSRVATGGLDTKIRIWATSAILSEQAQEDDAKPKLLSTLTSHSGVVMCIRWSNTGTFLASGSDDKVVMIWALESGSGGRVWGTEETNVENWKAVRRCVAHDSDVAGVAWSPDDAYLASAALDNTVMIWSGSTFQLLRRLDGHLGFVKGIVFDPVGQFLASLSDDNTLKIWRTSDWKLHASVAAPFIDAPKTTVTRLSWSPEGTYIITPNSMNGPVFVAAVIERGTFESRNSMVGHEDVVEVAAFSPIVLLRDPTKPATADNFCTLIALAARNQISIWVTSQSQPLVVLDDVCDRDILDMSWSADGKQLWSCSSEGHITVFTFELSEFGTPAPAGALDTFFMQVYGVSPAAARAKAAVAVASSTNGTGGTMSQPNKLVARKGPGAKRIVPRAVQPIVPTPPTLPQSVQAVGMTALPAIPGMHAGGPVAAVHQHAQTFALQSPSSAPSAMQQQQQQPTAFQSALQVAPTYNTAPPPNVGWTGAVVGTPEPIQAATSRKRKTTHAATGSHMDQDEYTYPEHPGVPGYGSYPRLSQAPYRAAGQTLGPVERDAPHELRTLRPAYMPREREVTFEVTNRDQDVQDGKPPGLKVLAVPQVLTHSSVMIEDGDKDQFEYRNHSSGDLKGMSELTVTSKDKALWTDYLAQYVVLVAGSASFAAAATEEGTLVIYSPTGRRLLPTLVLDSPCSFLTAEGPYLMAITSYGTMHVWSTTTKKALFPPLSITSLLTASATNAVPHPTITTSSLLPNGSPLIALSSGSTHTYDVNLYAWSVVCDTWWSRNSDFWEGRRGGRAGGVGSSGRGIVRTIESAINEIVVDQLSRESESDESEDEAEAEVPATAATTEDTPQTDAAERTGEAGKDQKESSATDNVAAEAKDGDLEMQDAGAGTDKTKAIAAGPARKRGKGWEIIVEARPQKRRRTVPKQATSVDGAANAASLSAAPAMPTTTVSSADTRRTAISLAHLETRMAAAIALDSPAEYKQFLLMYARKLNEESLRSKAEELVRELFGPVYYRPGKTEEWQPSVLGLQKRDLLKDVLREMGKNRSLSSLVSEFQDMLKKVNG
ncbi:HIR complex subunit [Microbotryomycetes sp. JL201]|nr:HIR complex subunit [Microbotryomycetes sp. JL201]